MDEEQTEKILIADLGEVRLEAIAFFEEKFNENKEVCAAWDRVYWDIYEGISYQDDNEHTFGGDCKLISDWLDDLTYAYNETEALHPETYAVLWANVEYVYANDFKVKLVGKEVAGYV